MALDASYRRVRQEAVGDDLEVLDICTDKTGKVVAAAGHLIAFYQGGLSADGIFELAETVGVMFLQRDLAEEGDSRGNAAQIKIGRVIVDDLFTL